MDSGSQYKKIGTVLIILLLVLIPAEIALTRPNAIQSLQLQLKLTTQEKAKVKVIPKEEVAADFNHPALYFIDLEYDPISNSVTKISSGKTFGDIEALAQNPSISSGVFNYKIEVISSKRELVSSGWVSLFKTVITKEDGTYIFRVVAPYEKGENLNIYLANNQKLWEESVK